MSQSAFETSEQVLKFDPKAKGRSDVASLDAAKKRYFTARSRVAKGCIVVS